MTLVRELLSWILSLFLIAVFISWAVHPQSAPVDGQTLLFDLPGENVFFTLLARNAGIALFEPTGRLIAGGILCLVSLLLLIPHFRRVMSLFVLIITLALAGLQVSPLVPMELPLTMGASESDGGARFYLLLACAVSALLLFLVHKRGKPVEFY